VRGSAVVMERRTGLCRGRGFLALTITRWAHIRRQSCPDKAVLITVCLITVLSTMYFIGIEQLRECALWAIIVGNLAMAIKYLAPSRN
jgi:hypothetical protein